MTNNTFFIVAMSLPALALFVYALRRLALPKKSELSVGTAVFALTIAALLHALSLSTGSTGGVSEFGPNILVIFAAPFVLLTSVSMLTIAALLRRPIAHIRQQLASARTPSAARITPITRPSDSTAGANPL